MTDREAANMALKKSLECLAWASRYDQRVKQLEERFALLEQIVAILAEGEGQ